MRLEYTPDCIECGIVNLYFSLHFFKGANSPRQVCQLTPGVPTRPVRCGSFILQSWRNVKNQILKIAVICCQDWNLIIYICFIILRLNMTSVEAAEEKVSNSPRSPLLTNDSENVHIPFTSDVYIKEVVTFSDRKLSILFFKSDHGFQFCNGLSTYMYNMWLIRMIRMYYSL